MSTMLLLVRRGAGAGADQRADRRVARHRRGRRDGREPRRRTSCPNLAIVTYNGATNFPLLAIPLFILAGAIMNASGISRRLIAFASSLFGWIRGGLAHVSIGASMFFAEISGSAVADVAALGSILIPGMKAKGYPAPLAAAVMSSAATLAVIIPPSIPMILYAVMAETSVVQLFRRRHRPGRPRRLRADGDGVPLRAPVQPAARGGVRVARACGRRRARRCGHSCCRSSSSAASSAASSRPPRARRWR